MRNKIINYIFLVLTLGLLLFQFFYAGQNNELVTKFDPTQRPIYFSPDFPIPDDAQGLVSEVIERGKQTSVVYEFLTKSRAEENFLIYKNYFEGNPQWNWKDIKIEDGRFKKRLSGRLGFKGEQVIMRLDISIKNKGDQSTLVRSVLTITGAENYGIGVSGPLTIPRELREQYEGK